MNGLKAVLLNTIFYLSFFLFSASSIPLFTVYIALFWLFMPRRSIMKQFRRAISWYGFIIIKVFPFPFIRIFYRDFGKGDPDGPYLFVCNHRSASDAFLMACLPYECVQVVNIWPFRIPVLGMYARLAGYLSIKEMSFEEFSQKSCDLLKRGVSIICFPEGTRSGSRNMGPFHGSIFRVALKSRCPIVPLCISGNEDKPRRGSLMLHPGIIRMHKLPALPWEKYKDLTAFQLKNKVKDIIAQELAVMEGEGE
ncbi:MAG: lysophospholipid acyltransferase family protein [bacterium]